MLIESSQSVSVAEYYLSLTIASPQEMHQQNTFSSSTSVPEIREFESVNVIYGLLCLIIQ